MEEPSDSETKHTREIRQIADVLENLGAAPESAIVMAQQLRKRASQIAAAEGVTEVVALHRLLEKVIQARTGD